MTRGSWALLFRSRASRYLAALVGLGGLIYLSQLLLALAWGRLWQAQLGRACLSGLAVLWGALTSPSGPALALLGVAALVTLRALWHLHRGSRRFRAPVSPVQCLELDGVAQRLGLAGRVELVRDVRPLAYTQGLLQPRIVLSTGLLGLMDREELVAILAHERQHLRCREPLRQLVAAAADAALFFLPLAGELYRRYRVEREIEADAAAARASSEAAIDRALVRLLAHGVPTQTQPAVGFAGSDLPASRSPLDLGEHSPFEPKALLVSFLLVLMLTVQVGLGLADARLAGDRLAQCPLPAAQAISQA